MHCVLEAVWLCSRPRVQPRVQHPAATPPPTQHPSACFRACAHAAGQHSISLPPASGYSRWLIVGCYQAVAPWWAALQGRSGRRSSVVTTGSTDTAHALDLNSYPPAAT